ncbi:uncharacterized protein TA06060 [Theileria annulata]|uniref:Haloacid dehalogenase-like family hydrolase n=1 Tax=Theileria annulata TaxID=5874 RepID=Q4UI51_THEAN|nr:uncharacterized protein TA06060 [Theileria annulata]CAI73238.1 hypothetical protein, conserved [Theileria annulata]|eukprot:XP_953915.1 hypothetical protein, conserved [Theileria annulata]
MEGTMDVSLIERLFHKKKFDYLEKRGIIRKGSCNLNKSNNESSIKSNISDFVPPETPPTFFAIDIDDTFYHPDEKIFSKNVEAFKKVKSLGFSPFFCTGRPLFTLKYSFGEKFFEDTGYSGFPGIYLNGAVVYDSEGKLISLKHFPEFFLDEILDFIVHSGLEKDFLFYDPEGHYCLKEVNDQIVHMLRTIRLPDPTITTVEELSKKKIVSIVSTSRTIIPDNARLGVHFWLRNMSFPDLIELCPLGITKADAIVKLMEHENARPESCAFIGDGENDVEIMQLVDMSFAVANSSNFVKKHAKWILHLNYYEAAFSYVMNLVYNINLI